MNKEQRIAGCLSETLQGMDGIVFVESVAEQSNVTPSDVVVLLRKYEAKGLITTGPSGMKGTYIKVLKNSFFEELKSK